jgi:anthranilate/para-aminobenzoate synthase component I
VQAGAGIVFDSVATTELEETGHKARGLAEALELVPALQTQATS